MKLLWKIVSRIILLILFVYGAIVVLGGGLGTELQPNVLPESVNFAHRGCCESVPRNSMTAFDKASNQNLAIETDLRQTKDGILVLFHDDTTNLKLGLPGSIADYNFDKLSNYPFVYNDSTTQEFIISFTQLLNSHPKTPLYLDIKTPSKTLADHLTLQLSEDRNNVLVADANILFLCYLKLKDKNIRTVWEGFDSGKEWTYHFIPKSFKPDYVASFRKNVSSSHIEWLREHGLLERKIVYGNTPLDSTLASQIPYHIVECE